MKEALTRRRILIAEVQEIQVQLSDKVRRLKAVEWNRSRESRESYYRWQQSAQIALVNKLQELRYVKDWIADREEESVGHNT
jgi:hypothetical protein